MGFLPQYFRAESYRTELSRALERNQGAELRDLIALTWVHSAQKNYGLAQETASRFFDRAREAAAAAKDPGKRQALEQIGSARDEVTAALAKGDAGITVRLQQLYTRTREVTF